MTACFPREARVRARAEFDVVFKDGRRTASPVFALHLLRDTADARLGLAVSRKVDKRAVGRNRIKRVLRDRFRHLRTALPTGAYVIVARPDAARRSNPELVAAFDALLQRAGALPLSSPAGTMPASATPPDPVKPADAGG